MLSSMQVVCECSARALRGGWARVRRRECCPGPAQAHSTGAPARALQRPVGGAGPVWMFAHTFLLSFDLAARASQELIDPRHTHGSGPRRSRGEDGRWS